MNSTQKSQTNSLTTIKRLAFIISILTLLLLLLTACGTSESSETETVNSSANEQQSDYAGKKIVWVDSYHADYDWSEGIEQGLHNVLDDKGVELQVMHMDTKRNTDESFGQAAALEMKNEIEAIDPDVVIACDDNAQIYLVVPYLKDSDLPIVFCGVNWDASIYGYPTSNVTGMIEIDAITQMVDLLELFAEGDKIAFLTEDTNTERKVFEAHNERFFNNQLEGVFFSSFDEFKSEFIRLQNEADMLYIGNNSSIADWDEAEAEAFIMENTTIPTGAIYEWMTPYALLVVSKSALEQGEWSAETALDILDGTDVESIPLVENKESDLILNLDLAEKLDVVFTPSMLRHGEIYEK